MTNAFVVGGSASCGLAVGRRLDQLLRRHCTGIRRVRTFNLMLDEVELSSFFK